MSEVKVELSWDLQPFSSSHQAADVSRWCVSARLKYIQRWFEEKGLEAPAVAVSVEKELIVFKALGSVRQANCRAKVAEELNAIWIEGLIRMSSFSLPKIDELIRPWLGVSSGSLEAEDAELLKVCLEVGERNPWIRKAWDPAFTEKSFAKVHSIAGLEAVYEHGNWSLGSAFVYRNLAFINQVDGGDEWLVIRTDAGDFESWPAGWALKQDPAEVRRFVEDCLAATPQELQQLEYRDARLRCA